MSVALPACFSDCLCVLLAAGRLWTNNIYLFKEEGSQFVFPLARRRHHKVNAIHVEELPQWVIGAERSPPYHSLQLSPSKYVYIVGMKN